MDAKRFTAVDRDLLRRCLNRQPGAWNDFIDRFLSLIYHVINYTAYLRSARLSPEDVEDIAAEILLRLVEDDFKILRQFRGESSLATYLTVVARRLCVQELVKRQKLREAAARGEQVLPPSLFEDDAAAQKSLERLEEVERFLKRLKGREREIVRLYYLEGRTYEEISIETGVPVGAIGVVLSRARKKLREMAKMSGVQPAATPARPVRRGAPAASGPAAAASSTPAASATPPSPAATPSSPDSPPPTAESVPPTPPAAPPAIASDTPAPPSPPPEQ